MPPKNRKYLFASVMGLEYYKSVLYTRLMAVAKRYLRFYRYHGLCMIDISNKAFFTSFINHVRPMTK